MAFDERHPQYTNSSRVYAGVGTEKQTDGVRRTPSDSEILPRVYAGTGEEKQTDGVRRTPSHSEILTRVYAGVGTEKRKNGVRRTPRTTKHERSPQYGHYRVYAGVVDVLYAGTNNPQCRRLLPAYAQQ